MHAYLTTDGSFSFKYKSGLLQNSTVVGVGTDRKDSLDHRA